MLYVNDHLDAFSWEDAMPQLSAQRRQQVLRFQHEQGRKTCAAAYLLLCEGLQSEYGIAAHPDFEYGEHGKPRLAGFSDIHFNLSHCRQAVACAISDQPVGIDVEGIREYKESLARYTMNDEELEAILTSPSPAVTFTRLWTMKEAVVKLTGEGIAGSDLKTVLGRGVNCKSFVNKSRGYVLSIAQHEPLKNSLFPSFADNS